MIYKSILIVEDDRDIREGLKELLQISEFVVEIVTAIDGKDALKKIHGINKPYLVILDLIMPNMDGLEFIKYVRENSIVGMASIVVLTASNKTVPGAFVRVVKKPVDIETLFDVIRECCEEKRNDRVDELEAFG